MYMNVIQDEALPRKYVYFALLLLILASLPVKLLAAQNMPWDIDIVPVVSRLAESPLPATGTLSSVAAYNMPMLQWLHLPAFWVTGDVYGTILLTLITFNILSTIAVFCIGDSMFDARVGLGAALLFTFSETGISSSYTAWAQLLLPGYYAMTLLFIWEWHRQEKGLYLALSGIAATAAFMTHFSAILLYPALLVFALLTRARWQWRGLFFGSIACMMMLAPYLNFDRQEGFANVRAFLKQDSRVDPQLLDSVAYLKPEGGILPREQASMPGIETPTTSPNPETTPSVQPSASPRPSLQERFSTFAGDIPRQVWRGLSLGFDTRLRGLDAISPDFTRGARFFINLPFTLFLIGFVYGLGRTLQDLRFNSGFWPRLAQTLTQTPYGKISLINSFLGVIIMSLVVTRSGNQPTYFMGLSSAQYVVTAAMALIIAEKARKRLVLVALLVLFLGYGLIQSADRVARWQQHDDTQYSRYQVSLYRHVSDAVDFIAEDWGRTDALTISYDIMPEMRNLWWVVAWNSIDPSYRMGMNFDFLLEQHHGLGNENQDPVGYIEEADYFIVYEPGLGRFALSDYEVHAFGAIYVLKP